MECHNFWEKVELEEYSIYSIYSTSESGMAGRAGIAGIVDSFRLTLDIYSGIE